MTQSAPTPERCMSILLPEVLDHLGLWDIVHVMAVNRLWREHAINHPTYYGDLCLLQLDPLDMSDLFLLRLSRSAGRPISVYVDLREQIPLSVMQEIGDHLAHITSLTVSISFGHSVAAVVDHLCHPAPILRHLSLRIGIEETITNLPPPSTLPANFLAHHAPVLDFLELQGFDLLSEIPDHFSTIRVLSFFGFGWDTDPPGGLVLPNPFEQCPNLHELRLGGYATLRPDACRYTHAWKLMTDVSFYGDPVASRWPAFRLPLDDVQTITVADGDAESVLCLAGTLSGPLHVSFMPPLRQSFGQPVHELVDFTTVLRSLEPLSGYRSRVFEGTLTEYGCISAFSVPSLSDRIVRLELALEAWDDFVGLSTFGPFHALDELVLNLNDDAEFKRSTALPRLSCPELRRLVLRGTQRTVTTDMAAVAEFARASLSQAQFPLRLESDGIALAGAWYDFPESFSGYVCRGQNDS